uniref:small monomeric GTPase n=1 Tax=Leptobrachium leishanense TaxID=445787 RepID=A0A8C5R5M6_9ANUR
MRWHPQYPTAAFQTQMHGSKVLNFINIIIFFFLLKKNFKKKIKQFLFLFTFFSSREHTHFYAILLSMNFVHLTSPPFSPPPFYDKGFYVVGRRAGVLQSPIFLTLPFAFICRDTSGQGRFCTIFRSYSRGAQGILLVYDITNRWSFDGIDRWIKEIDEHAPGVPRILVGNRLHLAFKRQVPTEQARAYAEKNGMTFFEVSPLCNFNVTESFTELSRIVLMRHGMEKIWRPNRVFSLQDLCCRAIVSCTPVHLIDKLPLPVAIKSHLKSFSMANGMNAVMMHGRSYSVAGSGGGASGSGGGSKGNSLKRSKSIRPPQSPPQNCSRSNCKIS